MLLNTVRNTPVTLHLLGSLTARNYLLFSVLLPDLAVLLSGLAKLRCCHLENSKKQHWDLNSQWSFCWNRVVLRSSYLFSLVLEG